MKNCYEQLSALRVSEQIMTFRKQESKRTMLLWGLSIVSASLLAGAYWFQYVEGLHPCSLCLWQRWPHYLVCVLGILAFTALRPSILLTLAIMMMFVTGGIGFYHAGVELSIFAGPDGCTASFEDLPVSEGLQSLLDTSPIRCDEVVWSFLGLSMAAWNGVISTLAGVISMILYRRS